MGTQSASVRTQPWPTTRERAQMVAERFIGPLMLLSLVCLVGVILRGPAWLVFGAVAGFPLAYACTMFSTGGGSAEGWQIEKRSQGGSLATWQLRLNNNRHGQVATENYVVLAAKRGYVPSGPPDVVGKKLVTTFVREPAPVAASAEATE